MRHRPFVFVLVFSTACFNWGTRPENFPPAMSAQGVHVAVRVRGESRDRVGELLAVDSVGITVRDSRVIRVAWSRVEALDVANEGSDFDIAFGETVTAEKRARLSLLSRFPQGIDRLPIKLDSLIADATRETARFAERRVAIDEGYRRVGADFPGMGEHWLNFGALLRNRIDATRPALLTYATIAGRPTLLGVGFVVVTHGDSVPADVPGWPAEWHEHSGLLADESAGMTRGASGTHVWVMHVWTSLANPDGSLAADNWSLPFLRAGVAAPDHADADVGRAMSLAVGGDDFLRDALTDADLRTASNARAVDSLIAEARARVRANVDVASLRARVERSVAVARANGGSEGDADVVGVAYACASVSRALVSRVCAAWILNRVGWSPRHWARNTRSVLNGTE